MDTLRLLDAQLNKLHWRRSENGAKSGYVINARDEKSVQGRTTRQSLRGSCDEGL